MIFFLICGVYHRNTPQPNICHDKRDSYFRFVQAIGEKEEATEEKNSRHDHRQENISYDKEKNKTRVNYIKKQGEI